MINNTTKPLSFVSGGLVPSCCPTVNALDLTKPPDSAEGAAARIQQDEADAKRRRAAVRQRLLLLQNNDQGPVHYRCRHGGRRLPARELSARAGGGGWLIGPLPRLLCRNIAGRAGTRGHRTR
jgi:hypothetical protein